MDKVSLVYYAVVVFWTILWSRFIDPRSAVSALFIAVPYIVFAIAIVAANFDDAKADRLMLRQDIFAMSILIGSVILGWEKLCPAKRSSAGILITAFVILLFSHIDVWVPEDSELAFIHLRSCLRTIALVFAGYGLYSYYEAKMGQCQG